MNFYTSDLHFGHPQIIELAHRPFSSVEEMNQTIISNINNRCKADDTLYILGDVGFNGNNVINLLRQINCHKILIVGNHDHKAVKYNSFIRTFDDIKEYAYVHDGQHKIYLSHYPHAEWDGFHKGWWHFYGHVHNSQEAGAGLIQLVKSAVNVGVDINDFQPKTAEELIKNRLTTFTIPDVSLKEFVNKLF